MNEEKLRQLGDGGGDGSEGRMPNTMREDAPSQLLCALRFTRVAEGDLICFCWCVGGCRDASLLRRMGLGVPICVCVSWRCSRQCGAVADVGEFVGACDGRSCWHKHCVSPLARL
ncbi:hypothetical protein TraAM80_06325 [Trypanosoma rangeli]|uniref:Uncharacterized protein n=1 Tax=Trypanosoma rangeli TaxID=5698 RepID=A0A3R7KW47_TRYRA|nr:uncharacterized protein TraAM80_06325 [Trypanosoma rangeli]RNF02541.1 hypothetical protein TraAM80_06325 [Trypanosoma rangeli]|eukprot:RNF02541.1 hypothetical protein TraAM80_06325 [Trypanosoma rangeli]